MEDDRDLYESLELASEFLDSLSVLRDRTIYVVWHPDDESLSFFLYNITLYVRDEQPCRDRLPCKTKPLHRVGESCLLSSVVEGNRAHNDELDDLLEPHHRLDMMRMWEHIHRSDVGDLIFWEDFFFFD
jgi:hypothetical protein